PKVLQLAPPAAADHGQHAGRLGTAARGRVRVGADGPAVTILVDCIPLARADGQKGDGSRWSSGTHADRLEAGVLAFPPDRDPARSTATGPQVAAAHVSNPDVTRDVPGCAIRTYRPRPVRGLLVHPEPLEETVWRAGVAHAFVRGTGGIRLRDVQALPRAAGRDAPSGRAGTVLRVAL